MDFQKVIEQRCSVRSYKPEKPSAEQLYEIVEAARLAPSACNRQPWKFFVITEEETLQQIRPSYARDWFATAPAVIVVAGNHNESWHRPSDNKDHCDIDIAIATEHAALAAAGLGLGTCWICNFDNKLVENVLGLESGWEAIAMLPVGIPDMAEEKPRQRKPIEDVAVFIM